MWMRESGTVIDKLVLTKDSAYDPSALNGSLGPNESAQVDTATPADLVHYWKLDETSGKTFQDQIGAAPATSARTAPRRRLAASPAPETLTAPPTRSM